MKARPVRLVLPNILPDETLYSLVARIYQLNAEATEREFCSQLLGEPDALRVADADVDLSRLEEITRGFYGDAEDLLATTTMGCLYRRLGTVSDVDAPKNASDKNLPHPTGLATLSNGRPHVWRACRSCVTGDQAEHGTSYWHRMHQLPGTTVCLKHRELLLELNLPYRDRQRSFVFPHQVIDRLDRTPNEIASLSLEIALGLSALSEQALRDSGPSTPAWAIRGALLDGLTERGLTTRDSRVNKRAFIEEFTAFYRGLAGTSELGPFLLKTRLLRLADGMMALDLLLPATHTLMLAYWLFGLWDRFKQRCEWRLSLDAPVRIIPSNALKLDVSRGEHRKTCLKFVSSTPSASRAELWQTHPKACRWLTQYDSEWLDSILPKAKKHVPSQLDLFARKQEEKRGSCRQLCRQAEFVEDAGMETSSGVLAGSFLA